ncbi:MAG: DUF4405 domain-containing protein [Gammaproteobacteria bacterium]|nr:DUF4405 domain-containing protein [Gammaproteobacteria bacterium]
MKKNKQSSRSLTAFLVTWAFIVLTVTGIILYIVPQGRIAHWVHWSLLGMSKDQWSWVHMMFGGVFIFTGFLHLYFNWKPFKKYFADKVKGHFKPKQEIFIATAITVFIFVVSALNIPPASWVIDLNGWLKGAWVTSPELEPPYGHAEESSLAGISRKIRLDINKITAHLDESGIQFSGKKDTLDNIARNNGTTPMAIYEMIKIFKLPEKKTGSKKLSAEEIEDKYSGTGLGRKTITEICAEIGIPLEVGLKKLMDNGVEATGKDKARPISEKYDKTPIDLMKILLL